MKYLKLLLVLLCTVIWQGIMAEDTDDNIVTKENYKYRLYEKGESSLFPDRYFAELVAFVNEPTTGGDIPTVIQARNPTTSSSNSKWYGVEIIADSVFFNCQNIKNDAAIVNIRIIGNSAYQGCKNLPMAWVSSFLQSVGSYAFEGCTSLDSIRGLNSKRYEYLRLQSHAFEHCSSLRSFALGCADSVKVEDYAFNGCEQMKFFGVGDPFYFTSIGDYAFNGCTLLSRISVDSTSSVDAIGSHAFNGCSNLKMFVIPRKVTIVKDNAFAGCSSLSKVTSCAITPPTLGENAFPSNVVDTLAVPFESFEAYHAVTGWCFAKNMVAEDGYTVKLLTGDINYVLDKNTKTATVMPHCYSGDVVVPEYITYKKEKYTVTTLAEGSFTNSNGLTSITFPKSVTTVYPSTLPSDVVLYVPGDNYDVYKKCKDWKDVNLKVIGENDLYVYLVTGGLRYLLWKTRQTATLMPYDYSGSIEIPEIATKYDGKNYTVTAIGVECFKEATLESVNIPYTVQTIGKDAFKDAKLDTYVYNGDLDSWCNITFANGESNPASVVGKLIFNGEEISDVDLSHTSVSSVPAYAFYKVTGAKTVTLSENITTLGTYSFNGCDNLTTFTCVTATPPTVEENALPKKIATLIVPSTAYGTYYANSSWNFATNILSSEDNEATADFVTGGVLYQLDKAQKAVTVKANSYAGNVTVPATIDYNKASYPVTTIAADAFKGSNGVTVTIPASVKTISADAFAGATDLTYNFTGTISDWCAMTFENLNANPAYVTGKLIIGGEELKEVTLPETLTAVQANVFAGCI